MPTPAIIAAIDAVAPRVESRVMDISRDKFPMTVTGVLMADASISGRKTKFAIEMQSGSETDYKERFDESLASTEGDVRANKTWADTQMDPQQLAPPFEVRFGMAGKKGFLWIPETEANKLMQSAEPFDTFVSRNADKIEMSIHRSIQDDLMSYGVLGNGSVDPTRVGELTTDWTVWGQTETRLAHLAFALQGGGTGNTVSTTPTYQYGNNLNLNAHPNLKGITAGNSGAQFGVPSPENINTKILFPMMDANRSVGEDGMGRVYAFCDSGVYQYILNLGQNLVRYVNPSESLKFGYTNLVEYMGIIWIREPDLDRRVAAGYVRTIIFITPDSWVLRQYKLGKIVKKMGDDYGDRSGILATMRWDFAISLITKRPDMNGFAYDVRLS